jgi:hypothetical protein
MSARTDRITKLTALIQAEQAADHPNRAAKFTALCAKFEGMSDGDYDYLIALNAAVLADPTIKTQDFYRSYHTPKEG